MASRARLALAGLAVCAAAVGLGAAHAARGRPAAPRCELVRDKWGIPHVFAAREADGFFGLGYACAEDRRLQMELVRRKAAGRLAELFGPEWVDQDRDARINGYASYAPRAFAKLPARWQEALRAYAAGVNAWTAANPAVVARRFGSLGVQPEPWTPSDCLLAARGLLNLGSPVNAQPVEQYHRFQELVAQVGKEEAERRSSMFIDDSGAVVSEAEMARDAGPYARLKAAPRMRGYSLQRAGALDEPRKMSHAWAVSGRRSTTGKPILESDPQLPVGSPAFLHEFHLCAGSIDARGIGIPGCPGLFIGFNRNVAWGVSALGADSPVLFLDKHTRDQKGFQFRGQTVPFERRLERIRVKGGQTVVQEVLTNRHGAVVNSLVAPIKPGDAAVLYDPMGMEAGASGRALLEMMTATNWAQFRRGMEHYYWPGVHVVYADSAGNTGYQSLVHRPLTSRSPRLALEGWTGNEEITGRIPLDELPHMLNPKAGVISYANNLPVGSWYPYDLSIATGGTGNTGRSLRLHQLLAGTRKFSVDDFERVLHRDDVNPLVASLLPVARKVVEEDRVQNAAVLRLLDALNGWDMRESSVERFPAARAIRNTLTPYRGAGLNQRFGAGGGGVANLARAVAEGFARDGSTPKDPAVRAYLVRWLEVSAGGRAAGRGGADEWTSRMGTGAGAAGQTILIPYQRTEPHGFPAIDPSLDITSPPLKCIDTGTIWSQPGNFYTQIVDLGNPDNSRSMIAPGNSEDGAWRPNQIGIWAKGTTRAAPLSRAKILAMAASRTVLTPRPYQGPISSPLGIVAEASQGDRYVEAIPRPAAQSTTPAPSNAQGRKPDDPTLEAAFRFLLSANNKPSPEQIDAKLAEMREYVKRSPALADEFREALRFGIYLMTEAREGRLKVPYGSDDCLSRMRAALDEVSSGAGRDGSATQRSDGAARQGRERRQAAGGSRAQPEIWMCMSDVDQLTGPDADWAFVKRNLTGIKFYVGLMHSPKPGQLKRLVKLVKELNLQVAVELGCCLDFGPMDDTNGEWSAQSEIAALNRWYAAGGKADYLDLDGPVRRLTDPEGRTDGKRFTSLDAASNEVVDSVRAFHAAHPGMKYWHLTNFPNWGYKGDVSYHARGPKKQDYGEYDDVHRIVFEKLKAAGIPLEGVTIDNPYDYLIGEHLSVNLKPATQVDWVKRVRTYEDRSRAEGLKVNLIVNSERGGTQSDALFAEETLKMVDTYIKAGGRPDRWIVQSWYPNPKRIVPETDPTTMTGLVKAIIQRVRRSAGVDPR